MAQKVQVHLEDDLGGGPTDGTVMFALDGRDYEIDLSAGNAEKLRDALRPYAAAGRKAARTTKRSIGTRASRGGPDTAKIRALAKENGYEVSDRGRVHQHIRGAYYATH